MLTCSWIAYSGRVNLTSALQTEYYQKFCKNLSISELSIMAFFFLNHKSSFCVPKTYQNTGKITFYENDKDKRTQHTSLFIFLTI